MNEKEISEKMQEIMERMKNRRIELDMSYQTLADKVGLSKSTLQRYETGSIKNMPVDKLEEIAEALMVSPAYLMGWHDSENQEIAKRFNIQRKKKGLSIEDISRKSGLDYIFIKNLSKGQAYTESQNMALVAKAIDIDYFYLMGWVSEEEAERDKIIAQTNMEYMATSALEQLGHDYLEVYTLYSNLTEFGKRKALDNMRDLSMIYSKTNLSPKAAHTRTDIEVTKEMIQNDDDIMNDENF